MLGVVIPAYKREESLRQTLTSLTLQTKKSFYVIIVDDHSPTPLMDVAKEFKSKIHIKYIYLSENKGPGFARQIGLNYCYEHNFKYVVFLDSDDFLFPHALAKLYYEINTTNADVVSSTIEMDLGDGKTGNIQADNETFIHGKIYRTEFLKKNNITFPQLRTNEDLAFNLKVLELTKNHRVLNTNLHLFHKDPQSLTRNGENVINLERDYIEAIYDAAVFLEQNGGITNQIIVNIFNCYNYYQRMKIMGGNLSEERKAHLEWLLALPKVREKLTEREYLSHLPEIIKSTIYINDELKQFNQTFFEWLVEFGVNFKDENSSN